MECGFKRVEETNRKRRATNRLLREAGGGRRNPYSRISSRNSARELGFCLKPPRIAEVTIDDPCF